MARTFTVVIVSDIHYAGPAERARGEELEYQLIANRLLRALLRAYRRFIWHGRPLERGYLLDRFLTAAAALGPDLVVANGDYACNTRFVGVSDDATGESARECLSKLRQQFGPTLRAGFGDHELGKLSMFGGHGGMRLASWERACGELGLQPFWRVDLGNYVLMGVTSSLVALPVFEPETLPAERARWWELRAAHLAEITAAFAGLRPEQKVWLFCHDPTALPFLWREPAVRERLDWVENTIIGHLHTRLVFWKSRLLAGMPVIRGLGNTARRMSTALHEARHWRPFRVRLCPSLAGVELLRDGGFYAAYLDAQAQTPARLVFHPAPR